MTLPAPIFPPGDAPSVCVPVQSVQQDFLDLFERILPIGYLAPLKVPGPGYELLQAFAKVFERVSLAVGRVECGLFFTSSFAGVKASGTVEFYRSTTLLTTVTVLKGAIVTTSKTGRDFVTTADAVFGPADLVKTAPVQAIASGWEWNVPGQGTTPDGEILPGEIDTVKRPLQSPEYGDPAILVRQILATTGGQAAMLDQLGLDRGLPRLSGEDDRAYRARIRALPDTVSLDGIRRTLVNFLKPLAIPFTIIETFELTYQGVWLDDSPASAPLRLPIPGSAYDPNLFTYDDPRPIVPFRNRWLDEEEARGTFIVVMPRLDAFADVGMAWDDDTSDTVASHATVHGRRAHNAFDVPFNASPSLILQGGFDGFDLAKSAVYKNVFDLLQDLKAAGIVAVLEQEGN